MSVPVLFSQIPANSSKGRPDVKVPLRRHTSALFRKFGLHGGFDAFAQGFHAGIVGDSGIFSISKSGRIAGANHEINAIHCRQIIPSSCLIAGRHGYLPDFRQPVGWPEQSVCMVAKRSVLRQRHISAANGRTGILWHVSAFTGDTVL